MQERISKIRFLIDRHKYDDALEMVVEALAETPDSGYLYALKSEIYEHKDETELALETIEKAVALEPEAVYVHQLHSHYLFQAGEWDNALIAIDEAIRIDPDRGRLYSSKALIRLSQRKGDKALELARRGVELAPDNETCANILSYVLTQMGSVDASDELLEDIMQFDPENAFSHANLGYNYLNKKDVDNAKKHFAESLRIDPDYEFARLGMIETLKNTNLIYRLRYQHVRKRSLVVSISWMVALLISWLLVFQDTKYWPVLYITFAWEWYTHAIADMILFCGKYARNLMSEEQKLLAESNLWIVGILVVQIGLLGIYFGYDITSSAVALSFSMVPMQKVSTRAYVINKFLFYLYSFWFMFLGFLGTTLAFFEVNTNWILYLFIFSFITFMFISNSRRQ